MQKGPSAARTTTPQHRSSASVIRRPQQQQPQRRLAVFFSTGDLGDVGRHVIFAALEIPEEQVVVTAFARNVLSLLRDTSWKCACSQNRSIRSSSSSSSEHHQQPWRQQPTFAPSTPPRVVLVDLDCTQDRSDDDDNNNSIIVKHLQENNIDAIAICLGNRQIFHEDCIARQGTERILRAAARCSIHRIVALSSVGICDDWPPMEWSSEGRRLESLFRTVCWKQYQDLTGAEKAVRRRATESSDLDFLIVRTVLLSETDVPTGEWCLEQEEGNDSSPHHHRRPTDSMAKMDCARFLVQEAVISPSLHRCAVTIGGCVPPSNVSSPLP